MAIYVQRVVMGSYYLHVSTQLPTVRYVGRPEGSRPESPERLGAEAPVVSPNVPAMIVLVEDNPADILLMREALAAHNVQSQLFIAEDGDEAFELIEKIEAETVPCPHLIVLDLNLPRKSGLQILERIRASTQCFGIPVMIFSSSEAPSDRENAARLGASCYMRKPNDLKEFLSIGRKLGDMLAGNFD